MDPSTQFCPNFSCLKRGLHGEGNLRVHSRPEQRYRGTPCGKTFAASKNTPFYRLHKPVGLATVVLTLLTHGCPLQAAVAAFGLDERTVADWQQKAGQHAQRDQHTVSGYSKVADLKQTGKHGSSLLDAGRKREIR